MLFAEPVEPSLHAVLCDSNTTRPKQHLYNYVTDKIVNNMVAERTSLQEINEIAMEFSVARRDNL